MSDVLPEFLTGYLTDRDRQRATEVADALNALSERERRLFQEAAVMGWVQGMRAAQAGDRDPGDFPKAPIVVAACLSMPDLYPVISRYVPPSEDDDDRPSWTR
jgi:hypothetical protein